MVPIIDPFIDQVSHFWHRIRPAETPMPWLTFLSALLILCGSLVLQSQGEFDSTPSFVLFCVGAALMGVGYLLAGDLPQITAAWFWGVTLLSRMILLPMASGDDVWRYLWEGYLQTNGISPYGLPPNAEALIPLRTEWWDLMNYHDVSAIYPPVAQLGFRVLAHISLSVLAFKVAFVLADLAVCWCLSHRYGFAPTLLYAWNPIVIYAFAGGAHYDSWFVLPIVLAWLSADQRRWLWSAFWVGVSIGVKWVSLPLLVFLIVKSPWQRAIALVAVASIPLLVTTPGFCAMGSCALIPVQSSFVVQARSADLVPYLVSLVWPASLESNRIFALPLAIAGVCLLRWCRAFGTFAEAYFGVLLIFSPVVHAWYFSWLIPFSVASRNWGTRLLGVSGFVYFLLPYRQFAGLETVRWHLTALERLGLWLPFLAGFLGSFSSSSLPVFRKRPDNYDG